MGNDKLCRKWGIEKQRKKNSIFLSETETEESVSQNINVQLNQESFLVDKKLIELKKKKKMVDELVRERKQVG